MGWKSLNDLILVQAGRFSICPVLYDDLHLNCFIYLLVSNLRYAKQITDAGLDHLRYLTSLRELELVDCSVTPNAKFHLRRSTGVNVTIW